MENTQGNQGMPIFGHESTPEKYCEFNVVLESLLKVLPLWKDSHKYE